jgi:signal transduction histidine kinase
VDPEAVGQILFNLVDNACKYAASGRAIDLRVTQGNGQVRLAVCDRGPGIDPQQARAVFHAFDRGSRRTGDSTPGVGLGLALARGLARKLGGDLTLDGSYRDGACFRLTLPVATLSRHGEHTDEETQGKAEGQGQREG